eukprot:TRINITY_DN632_c5_g1_i1.p1 TRINITY_DN632_c5_g1~~TRINITY_DN632_c5_g1_i1.p1  ORF type:complete len:682 (+),score=115.46 TRINITY_DN632_c5_g1_i1:63-2108(+)
MSHGNSMAPEEMCTLELARQSKDFFVEAVTLAEFDIDLGAVIRCSYPENFSANDVRLKYLAEQMLADRSEGHDELQTVFFFNRETDVGKPDEKKNPENQTKPPLNTTLFRLRSSDSTWVRIHPDEREQVKFTPKTRGVQHSKSEIFIVNSAGETLQSIPVTEGLNVTKLSKEETFEKTNENQHSVVVSGAGCGFDIAFLGTESTIAEIHDLLQNKPPRGPTPPPEDDSPAHTQNPFLYCFNITMRKNDPGVRRGAIIKAVSIACRLPCFLWCFEDVLRAGLQQCLDIKEDENCAAQKQIVKNLFQSINDREAINLDSAEMMSPARYGVWKYIIKEPKKIHFKTKIEFNSTTYKVAIPYQVSEEEICVRFGSVRKLFEIFKESTLSLIDAVLSGHRVVLSTYNHSAQEICAYVLAVASCLVPPFNTILKSRVFPYTSLTCMDTWQPLSSCIVGATNPMFEHRKEWWDILGNIDTGKISVNADISHAAEPSDTVFAAKIMGACVGRPDSYIEDFMRYHIRGYFESICKLAVGDCLSIPDTELHTLWENNTARIKKWKDGGFLSLLPPAFTSTHKLAEARTGLLRLRGSKMLTEEDSIVIYQNFIKTVRTEEDLITLLSWMPREADGLFPIALGLFHPSYAVKLPCIAFLRRIDALHEGKLVIHSLNTFLLLAYERNSRLMPVT